jgi:protein gp37
MADGTKIEWAKHPETGLGATWNVITGCAIKSPACASCYAMQLAGTRLRNHPSRAGLTKQTKVGPVWTGEVRFNGQWLDQPLQWTKPRDVFVVAHGDLFYERVPFAWIDRLMAVMILSPNHRFQVLTKRPERMLQYFSGGGDLYHRVLEAARPLRAKRPILGDIPIDDPGAGAWHRNILLGASVERQQEADERRPHLKALADMGWRTWVSYEPALGPVNWEPWGFIKWLVSGGESKQGGKEPRPSHPAWHRATRDFCQANGIPYHFKQWGVWSPCDDDALPSTFTDARMSDFLCLSSCGHAGNSIGDAFIHKPDRYPACFPSGPDGDAICNSTWMRRVGKKAAGALLDGREWNEMPHA